jgi:uncharacterized SAM-binding protein YcdF (DUF218 family)
LLQLFAFLWRSIDDIHYSSDNAEVLEKLKGVDVIVPLSYTTGRRQLMDATELNLLEALQYKKICPDAQIAFSSCSYPFEGAAYIEHRLKVKILIESRVDFISGEDMINSVDEAEKIKEALLKEGVSPRRILLVTGELHTRSARYIWSKLFPEAEILVAYIPYPFGSRSPKRPSGSRSAQSLGVGIP